VIFYITNNFGQDKQLVICFRGNKQLYILDTSILCTMYKGDKRFKIMAFSLFLLASSICSY